MKHNTKTDEGIILVDWISCAWAWTSEHATILALIVTTIATVYIAIFTKTLAGVTARQVALATDGFHANHRPILEVRFARRLREVQGTWTTAAPILVEFFVINTGTAAGTITGSRVRLDWFHPDDVPNPDAMDGTDLIPHSPTHKSRRSFEVNFSNRGTELLEPIAV